MESDKNICDDHDDYLEDLVAYNNSLKSKKHGSGEEGEAFAAGKKLIEESENGDNIDETDEAVVAMDRLSIDDARYTTPTPPSLPISGFNTDINTGLLASPNNLHAKASFDSPTGAHLDPDGSPVAFSPSKHGGFLPPLPPDDDEYYDHTRVDETEGITTSLPDSPVYCFHKSVHSSGSADSDDSDVRKISDNIPTTSKSKDNAADSPTSTEEVDNYNRLMGLSDTENSAASVNSHILGEEGEGSERRKSTPHYVYNANTSIHSNLKRSNTRKNRNNGKHISFAEGTAAPSIPGVAVGIVKHEYNQAGGYMEYTIQVWQNGRSWLVPKRYSEFQAFNTELCIEFDKMIRDHVSLIAAPTPYMSNAEIIHDNHRGTISYPTSSMVNEDEPITLPELPKKRWFETQRWLNR